MFEASFLTTEASGFAGIGIDSLGFYPYEGSCIIFFFCFVCGLDLLAFFVLSCLCLGLACLVGDCFLCTRVADLIV